MSPAGAVPTVLVPTVLVPRLLVPVLLAVVLLVSVLLVPAADAHPSTSRSAAAPFTVTLDAPSDVPAGATTTVAAHLLDESGAPAAGQPVSLAQVGPDGSTHQHLGVTDPGGRATWSLTLTAGAHTLTASAADGSASPTRHLTAHPDAVGLAVEVEPPAPFAARGSVRFTVTRTPYGSPVTPAIAWPGAPLVWQRLEGSDWRPVGSAPADDRGVVTTQARPGRFRAIVAATATSAEAVTEFEVPRPPAVGVRLSVPARAQAGTRVRLRVSTEGTGGRRVRVVLQARERGTRHRWVRVRRATTRRTDLTFRHRPVYDVRYRARVVVAAAGRKHRSSSAVARVHLTPEVAPFRAPAGAPEPRHRLPAQARATQTGPAAVIRGIDDRTWRSMVGRSWRPGCPVGRADLRLLRINYYGFDGYRHRGEIVAHRNAVHAMARGLSRLHRHRVRVRSMYRVDRFGWSSRLGGADDYASMAAGNTSAFNCRGVVGRPSRRSPHSRGRSLDLNPWENPYYSPADGWVPNDWYRHHSAGVQTWRSRDHLVVRLLRSAGLRWTYGVLDSHHFDG